MRWIVFCLCAIWTSAATAQGLKGAPGGLLKAVDPKVVAFEQALLDALNGVRKKANKPPVMLDAKLRGFARHEAELAAVGSPLHKTFEARIKDQKLAPFGHRMQFGYATRPEEAAQALEKDATLKAAWLDGTTQRAGIGAFYVPETPPYFQYALLIVADPDPFAGRAGLAASDTDPVMTRAMPAVQVCYDAALKRDPNAKGDVIFQLVIGDLGQVDSAKLLRSIGDANFDACVLQLARGLTFKTPHRGKPVTLNHPIRLTPPQGNVRVGRLSPSQVQAGFGAAMADLKACYDKSAKNQPDLFGTITLGLSVSELGAITALDVVHDEPGDAALVACVLARVKQVRFAIPEFGAPLSMTYPLRFAASPKGKAPKK